MISLHRSSFPASSEIEHRKDITRIDKADVRLLWQLCAGLSVRIHRLLHRFGREEIQMLGGREHAAHRLHWEPSVEWTPISLEAADNESQPVSTVAKWRQALPIVARKRSGASPVIHHRNEKVLTRRDSCIERINNCAEKFWGGGQATEKILTEPTNVVN